MTTQISTTNIQSTALAFIQGPVVSSIQITDSSYTVLDDTAVDTAGGYIKINGVNFVAGMNVVIGSVTATSVSVVSSTVLNVQVPAQSAGSYIVYVIAPDGGVSIVINGLTYSGTPTWVTGSTLTDGLIDSPISIQLSATDATSYALAAGSSLPSGLTLTSGGLLSGTVTGLSSNTLYNFTINAIDAQLQDSPRAFSITIVVGDIYWKYVDTLLSANTPTSTFVTDASTNEFAVTVNGDTRPSNFGPYTPGYYSAYFDGTGDYLTAGSSVSLSSDFTVEGWIYGVNYGSNGFYLYGLGNDVNSSGATFFISTSGYLRIFTNNANLLSGTSATLTLNTWNHVAFVRNSGTLRAYLNGVQVDSASWSGTITGLSHINAELNGSPTATTYVGGACYISNHRVVTSAVYTSAFTPSTTPLTAIANTSLLTCQSNRFIDNSTNNFTVTRNGDTAISGFDPFVPDSSYTGYGSGYFDGTGDYVDVINSSTCSNFGTSDFTVEGWFYLQSLSSSVLYDFRTGPLDVAGALYYSGTDIAWYVSGANRITGGALVLNQWYHIAVSRNGSSTRLFVNGTQVGSTYTDTNNYVGNTNRPRIGYLGDGTGTLPFTGYMSNLRIVKGTALYTSAFTPSTTPFTAVANTSLLTLQNNQPINNNKFLDQSTNNLLMTAGGNAHQGAFNPYTGAWSNYFDGTTDMLTVTDNTGFDLSSGDFTVECWIMRTGDSGTYTEWVCGKREAGGGYRWSWNTGIDGSSKYYFGNGSTSVASTTSIAYNTWYHTAVVRSGSTITMYINGTAEATGTMTVNNYASDLTIGNYPVDNPTYTGYISNLRIVKGTAVYTSNFTVSTSPLTPITNTQLLTCQSNRFVDNGPQRLSVTRSGDVTVNKSSPFAPLTNYTPTSYSGYFDGNADYLTAPNNAAFAFGTGDFTIECWMYYIIGGSADRFIVDSGNGANFLLRYGAGTTLQFYANGSLKLSYAVALQNAWNHIAVVRSGTAYTLYVNGTSVATGTGSENISNSTAIGIGAINTGASDYYSGYISNLRIVKGTAVYTSAFTPSTTPLTSIANTSLLTCQSATFVDNSTNNFTITANGNSQPTIQNPFGYTNPSTVSYTPATYSGSAYFDGTGDNITTPWNNNLELGSGNFTIEFWIYPQGGNSLFCWSTDWHYGMTWNYGGASSNRLGVWASSNGSSWDIFNADGGGNGVSTGTITINQWSHVALVRNGSAWTLYINGVSAWTGTSSATIVTRNSDTFRIGGAWPGAGPANLTGFLSDFRIIKGQALYTNQFVPPATPLTSIQNTVLLVNGTNAGIYDSSMTANYQSFADTRITTSLEKYGTGSIYFDGTGDYLSTISNPNFAPGTGDFTWEAWVYFPSGSSYRQIFSNRTGATSSATNGSLAINPSNGLTWYTSSAIVDYTTSIGTSQWVHVAVCRSGTTLRVFANGTSVGSATNSQNLTGSVLTIGANNDGSEVFNGYMDDVRITNGIARYTSNFTPTTIPFLAK